MALSDTLRNPESDATALELQRAEERRYGLVDGSTHLDKEARAAVNRAEAGYDGDGSRTPNHPVVGNAAQFGGVPPTMTPAVPENQKANANHAELTRANVLGNNATPDPHPIPTLVRR